MAVVKITSPRTGAVTYAAVVAYRDEDGKRRQKRQHASNRKEAKRIEAELLRQRDEGTVTRSDRLLSGAYLEQWLAQQNGIRQTTATLYAGLLAPARKSFGAVPLTKLTPIHLMQLYGSLRAAGLSEKSILNTHRTLHKSLRDAIRWGLATRNVADLVDAPRPEAYEHYVISLETLRDIFAVADDTELGTLIRLAAWTGLRLGELLALTWADLDGNVLRIRQAYDHTGSLAAPKTEKSKRRLTLSPETVRMLEVHRTGVTDPEALIFRRADGRPFTHSAVDHGWRAIRNRVGIPRARFHDLRHSHATHLIAAGWPIALVSARLGHSTVVTTLNTYTHALPSQDVDIALAIDTVLA